MTIRRTLCLFLLEGEQLGNAVYKTLIFLVGVGLCVPYGIGRMVQVFAGINIVWVAVWFFFSHREIDLKAGEALRDVAPYVLLSVVFVYAVGVLTAGIANLYISLVVKGLSVSVAYCAALWLLRSTIFREIVMFITKKKIAE